MALFSSSPFTAGQFYDRTVTIVPYSGPLGLNSNYYSVTVPGRGGEPEREFFARLYHLDWSHQEKLCMLATTGVVLRRVNRLIQSLLAHIKSMQWMESSLRLDSLESSTVNRVDHN